MLQSGITATLVTGLQRNVPCRFRVASYSTQAYVDINDTMSAETTFTLSECLLGNS